MAGRDPPPALFCYSRNRGGAHPNRHLVGDAGILLEPQPSQIL
jgi:hypothetical protein